MLPLHTKEKAQFGSGFNVTERLKRVFRLLFSDQKARNLFFFLLLNLSFAFVELFYGMWTNSLSLISDSFHMFFDCTALLAGLAASVVTKWRANEKYSYGYVRAEVMAGFCNGLFLCFVAFFIFSEAVERLFEPPEVKHERLFIVSVLGFIVNLVGIFAFQHGGSMHSHGGSSHGSSHGDHGHSHGHGQENHGSHDSHGGHDHGHGHGHENSHGHSHSQDVDHGHSHFQGSGSQIFQGVFLHILADTLGSVGVIISSLLMYYFNWMIADPICSVIIASLVGLSVIPLLRDSLAILMQRQPRALDNALPQCLHRVSQLEGVYGVHEPHFWTVCSDFYTGTLRLEVAPNADARYILSQAHYIYAQIGVKQLYVQIDYAHN